MSRGPLSGGPHGSGKVRLGFTYRITTLSILHSAAVGPAHTLSGTIEHDCPPARPLTSSADNNRPPGYQYEPAPRPFITNTPPPAQPPRPRSLPSPRLYTTLTREPPGYQYMVYRCRVC